VTERAGLGRVVEAQLDRLLSAAGAVVLAGPPATGKRAIARRRSSAVAGRAIPGSPAGAAVDWAHALGGPSPVLVEDWHRQPGALEAVAAAVRADPSPGRFLLTGAIPELPAGPGIALVRVRPLSLAERGVATPTVSLASLLRGDRPELDGRCSLAPEGYLGEVLASGFPGIRPLGEPARRRELDRYLELLVAAAPSELGRPIRDPGRLQRRLAAYAAATATTVPESTIADVADQHRPYRLPSDAHDAYRHLLERLGILDELPAIAPRARLGRLAQAPKRHLADPALAARLLGLDTSLAGRSRVGAAGRVVFAEALFESLVTQSVRTYAQACGASVAHLRTYRGHHQLDLIVEGQRGELVALDVQFATDLSERDVAHLRWLRRRLGEELVEGAVVNAGDRCYRRPDGFGVVPAALLGP
jgi:hypothetical protein